MVQGYGSQSELALENAETDRIYTIHARWTFPESNFEAYGEWARTRDAESLTDFLSEPDYTQGYMLGAQQVLIDVTDPPNASIYLTLGPTQVGSDVEALASASELLLAGTQGFRSHCKVFWRSGGFVRRPVIFFSLVWHLLRVVRGSGSPRVCV